MRILNLKKAHDLDVQKWIFESIPELTAYQKQKIRDNEIVRFAPFEFMEHTEKVNNIFLRLSIIFIIPVFILLMIGLPINFIITGSWGYNKRFDWFAKWVRSCGL